VSTVEETLAWEAQWRPRAAAAAFAGALASIAGGILLNAAGRSGPDEGDGFVSLPQSLGAAAAGRTAAEPSLVVRQADELGDQAGMLTAGTLLVSLGALAALGALTYLFRASRARNPQIGRTVGWSVAAAIAIYPLAHAIGEIATWLQFADFADAKERTPAAAKELGRDGAAGAARTLEIFGALALALAFVLTALNAMRVGLLTRFMGILGILIGVLVLFPLDRPLLVRSIWLVFLGLLIAGRYPGGAPPAWATGRAEPWPTQQQLRERRDALRAEHRDDTAPEREPERELEPGDEGYAPGAARRKRKKRR
jgi:hypothetical protein